MGKIYSTEEAESPSTPASGKVVLYFKQDGFWYYKNDSGTEFKLIPGSGSFIPPRHIHGLTYSNSAGDPTNDIDIAIGSAKDSTNVFDLILTTAITKRLDAAWAVGTNQGGLDTGSIANSDYYIHLIGRSDTGVIDVLFSLSATAPTMPANYDYRRLIGWIKRVGAAIVLFTTYETEGGGIELLWTTPTLDINLINTLTTTKRTDPVKVPLNFSVIAILNIGISDAGACVAYIYCPDQADIAPSTTAAPMYTITAPAAVDGGSNLHIRTSTTGLIAARSTTATIDKYNVSTIGFTWARRN